ncbi:hypothetical protein [Acuticoccus sp. I52.16.1]|uniref:hypothetical protein n=1 Tax=Acuticoccus sp. I52.16.1 TaxID=2928472 RepID=UPI001FD5440B|nr:hypothetical protein [Acuticoccus sp. I52.16.1]UOM36129.1 hypothetical protein MRB58_08025 [Acuticoccus sp. I52.16.1]
MNKTGTTALQSHMARVRDLARADGLVYPEVLGDNHSMPLAAIFRPDDPTLARLLDRRGGSELLGRADMLRTGLEATCAAAAAAGHDLFLSGEGVGHFPQDACRDLRAFLLRYVDRIVVLAMVRPPRSFARSAAQQRVRYKLTFDDLAARPPVPTYAARFEQHRRVFGADAVRFAVYHRGGLVDGCILRTVLGMIERPLPSLAGERAPRENSAVSMTAIKLLSALNGRDGDPLAVLPPSIASLLTEGGGGRSVEALRRAVVGVPGPPFRLPVEVAAAVDAALAEDRAYVDAVLGVPIDSFDDRRDIAGAPRLADMARFSPDEVDAVRDHLARRRPRRRTTRGMLSAIWRKRG